MFSFSEWQTYRHWPYTSELLCFLGVSGGRRVVVQGLSHRQQQTMRIFFFLPLSGFTLCPWSYTFPQWVTFCVFWERKKTLPSSFSPFLRLDSGASRVLYCVAGRWSGGPQDSPSETRLSARESKAAQQLASPQPINPFFLEGGGRKWHIWVTHLLQGAASAGMLCCRATLQFCNSLYCIMVLFVVLQITIMGLHLLKPLDSSSP